MKKYFLILLAIALIASIVVGCAPTPATTTGEGTTSSSQTTTTSEPTTEENAEPINLTFFHFRAEDKELFAQVYEDYKAIKPNVTIEEEIIAGPDFKTTLQTRITSGVASDFFGINDVFIFGNQFNDAGLLMHLNDVEAFDKIGDQFKEVCTDDEGNLFAAVWTCANFGMFYNADLFESNNVAVPTNWAEFLKVCQTFKDKGIRPIAAGGKEPQSLYWILTAIEANDQYVKDPQSFMKINRGEAKFSDLPAFKSSLAKFDELVKNEYLSSDLLGITIADSITLFAQGKAAMLIGGAFHNKPIVAAAPTFEVKAMTIPGDNGENNAIGVPGLSFGVNAKISDEKKAASLEFLSYLFEPEIAKPFSEKSGTFSVLAGVNPVFESEATKFFMSKVPSMVTITMFDPKVVSTTHNSDLYAYLQGLFVEEYTVDEIPGLLDGLIS